MNRSSLTEIFLEQLRKSKIDHKCIKIEYPKESIYWMDDLFMINLKFYIDRRYYYINGDYNALPKSDNFIIVEYVLTANVKEIIEHTKYSDIVCFAPFKVYKANGMLYERDLNYSLPYGLHFPSNEISGFDFKKGIEHSLFKGVYSFTSVSCYDDFDCDVRDTEPESITTNLDELRASIDSKFLKVNKLSNEDLVEILVNNYSNLSTFFAYALQTFSYNMTLIIDDSQIIMSEYDYDDDYY